MLRCENCDSIGQGNQDESGIAFPSSKSVHLGACSVLKAGRAFRTINCAVIPPPQHISFTLPVLTRTMDRIDMAKVFAFAETRKEHTW